MRTKIFILLLVIICSSSLTIAVTNPGGHKDRPFDVLGKPAVQGIFSGLSGGVITLGHNEKQTGMFGYQMEPYEFNICTFGLTSDSFKGQTRYSGFNSGVNYVYGPITAQISGRSYKYSDNMYLYEITWYVHPKNGEINYSIYLEKSDKSTYLINPELKTANNVQGDSGYFIDYLDTEYVSAYLVTEDNIEITRVPIVSVVKVNYGAAQ